MGNNWEIQREIVLNMDRFSDLIQLIITARAADFFVKLDYRLEIVAKERRIKCFLLGNCPIFVAMKKVDVGWFSPKYCLSKNSWMMLIQSNLLGELIVSNFFLHLMYWNPIMFCSKHSSILPTEAPNPKEFHSRETSYNFLDWHLPTKTAQM